MDASGKAQGLVASSVPFSASGDGGGLHVKVQGEGPLGLRGSGGAMEERLPCDDHVASGFALGGVPGRGQLHVPPGHCLDGDVLLTTTPKEVFWDVHEVFIWYRDREKL